jgi:hypothetical protein
MLAKLAAVLVGGTAILAIPPTVDAQAGQTCADFQFIGVAGSGELPDGKAQRRTLWMGSTIRGLYDKVDALYKGSKTSLEPYGVRYAAIQVNYNPLYFDIYLNSYRQSVLQGVTNLQDHLRKRALECPAQQFILAGYSQGAQVIRETFARPLGFELKGRIRAMLLFGDPTFNPSNSDETVGNPTGGGRNGIVSTFTGVPGAVDPDDVQARTRSYCDARDPICQAPANFEWDADAHMRYGTWATQRAVEFLRKIQAPVRCAVSTATWSSTSNTTTNSKGITIAPSVFHQAEANPGYRFIGFVGVAEQSFYDSSSNTYSTRVVRIDQPPYGLKTLSPDGLHQSLSAAGRIYYVLASAVAENCGASASLAFSAPIAETRHVVLEGALASGGRPVSGKTLLWYHSQEPLPAVTNLVVGTSYLDNVTNLQGMWRAEYLDPVKGVIGVGSYRMALAFPGDANYLPVVSPILTVSVIE